MTTDERFPQIMCSSCVKDITTGYIFKLKLEQSDIFLNKEICNRIPEPTIKKKDVACSTDDLLTDNDLIEEVSEMELAYESCEKLAAERKQISDESFRKRFKENHTVDLVEVPEKIAITAGNNNIGNEVNLDLKVGISENVAYDIINEPISDTILYSMDLGFYGKPDSFSTDDSLNEYSYPQIVKCANMKFEAFEEGTYEISEASIELVKQDSVSNLNDERLDPSFNINYVTDEDEDFIEKPREVEKVKKNINNNGPKKTRRKRVSSTIVSTSLTCCACPESFTRLYDVKTHFVQMHTRGNFCMVCQKEYTQMKLHANVHFKLDNFFKCDKCPKAFNTEFMFAKHYTIFHPSYLCQLCDMDLKNEEAYKEHIISHEKRPVQALDDYNSKKHCEYCNKLFDGFIKLKCHFEEEHFDGSHCRICEKDVPKSNLFKHIQNHIKARRVRCDICKKYMTSSADLALKIHHTIYHDGYEVCQFCLLELDNKEDYDKHLLEHELNGTLNRYRCRICLKDTISVSTLLTHSTVHERLIQCQSCHHRYTSQSQYMRHLALDHKVKCTPTCRLCRLVEDNTES